MNLLFITEEGKKHDKTISKKSLHKRCQMYNGCYNSFSFSFNADPFLSFFSSLFFNKNTQTNRKSMKKTQALLLIWKKRNERWYAYVTKQRKHRRIKKLRKSCTKQKSWSRFVSFSFSSWFHVSFSTVSWLLLCVKISFPAAVLNGVWKTSSIPSACKQYLFRLNSLKCSKSAWRTSREFSEGFVWEERSQDK